MIDGRNWLVAGGALSAVASALHLGCIAGGPAWYRFFGAGEKIARMAERGWHAVPVTLLIAAVLAGWSAYALSGAGALPRLPLLRPALVAITAVYLLRGLIVLPIAIVRPAMLSPFWLWSSAIVLGYGIVHAVGVWRAWPTLSRDWG